MIEIHPQRDKDKLAELYGKYGIILNDESIAAVAYENGEITGCCLFDLSNKKCTIRGIFPDNDILFADGLLRSALIISVQSGVIDAFYSESAPEKIFLALDFIKDKTKRELNIGKLFETCKNCN